MTHQACQLGFHTSILILCSKTHSSYILFFQHLALIQ